MNRGTQLLVITLLLIGVDVVNALDVMQLTRMLNVTMQRNKPLSKKAQKKYKQLKKMLEMERKEEELLDWEPAERDEQAFQSMFLKDLRSPLNRLEKNLGNRVNNLNKQDIKSNIEIARNLLTINPYKKEKEACALFRALLRLLFYVRPLPEDDGTVIEFRMAFLQGLYGVYEPMMVEHQKKFSVEQRSKNKLPLFTHARETANDYERKIIDWMEQDVNWVPLSLVMRMIADLKNGV